MTRRSHQLLKAGAIVVSVAAAACSRTAPRASASERIRPAYDKSSGRLTRLEYDSNGDGKIDTWGYMDGMRVVRVEVDEDGDGKVDRWEYHKNLPDGAPQPGGIDKTLERIERATRRDGKVSRWEYFDNGALTRVEEDTDGDGVVDKWEEYSNGTLRVMAMDTQHRGKPDRRLVYGPNGSLDHVEADPTGSGTFFRVSQ
jgi:hypothetical protein